MCIIWVVNASVSVIDADVWSICLVSAVLGVLREGNQRAADRLRGSQPNPDPGAELRSSHPSQNTEGLSGRTLPLLESQSVESGV